MAQHVHGDDAIAPRQGNHVLGVSLDMTAYAMQQQHGRAFAGLQAAGAHAVDVMKTHAGAQRVQP